jgi:hypothetical protein
MAAFTAPQFVWPRTMISGTLNSAMAYSMLPLTVTPAPYYIAGHTHHEDITLPDIE